MDTSLDEPGAHALFAAITQRALLDVTDQSLPAKCREEAADFLAVHFPEWREWWHPKPKLPRGRARRRYDTI